MPDAGGDKIGKAVEEREKERKKRGERDCLKQETKFLCGRETAGKAPLRPSVRGENEKDRKGLKRDPVEWAFRIEITVVIRTGPLRQL